jgi:hypothetical protein
VLPDDQKYSNEEKEQIIHFFLQSMDSAIILHSMLVLLEHHHLWFLTMYDPLVDERLLGTVHELDDDHLNLAVDSILLVQSMVLVITLLNSVVLLVYLLPIIHEYVADPLLGHVLVNSDEPQIIVALYLILHVP